MMFKSLRRFLCATALASAVLAQNIFIALPAANATVVAGSNITVKLDKPMSLTGSQEVSVVIGAFACSSGQCPNVADVLGDILYSGPYAPQLYAQTDYDPYQNFTVTIPSWYGGTVQLGVAHFFLLGAGYSAELQLTNTTVDVVSG